MSRRLKRDDQQPLFRFFILRHVGADSHPYFCLVRSARRLHVFDTLATSYLSYHLGLLLSFIEWVQAPARRRSIIAGWRINRCGER